MDKLQKIERLNIKNGKQASVETHIVEENFPIHWHSFFEIEIMLSGQGKHIVNDVNYEISDYNMFVLCPTDFHYFRSNRDTKLINISFDESLLDEKDIWKLISPSRDRAYILSDDEKERLVAASDLLRFECENNENGQRQLLKYILKTIFRKTPELKSQHTKYSSAEGIRKALMYIDIHFKEDLSLTNLAAEAGYNPTYFSELFKKVTGETYTEALIKRRVSFAQTLLASGISVSDTCFLSGFSSLSNFYTAFKKRMGMSPSEYSKKYGG